MYDIVPKEVLPRALMKPIHDQINAIVTPARTSKGLPPVLHHYTDAAGLLGIVSSGSLRATHLAFLNDTREYLHAVSLLLNGVRARKATSHSQLLQTVLNELDDYLAPTQPAGAYVIDKELFPTAESIKTALNLTALATKPAVFKDGDKLIELRTVFL